MPAESRTVAYVAIVLAGGRSSRLGSVAKATLKYEGQSLLERTLQAVSSADRVVVVGPAELSVPDGALLTREDPPFSGPTAGVIAGFRLLQSEPEIEADRPREAITLIAACDMPRFASLVPSLISTLAENERADATVAVDNGGRRQHLAAAFRTEALRDSLERIPDAGVGKSASAIFEGLRVLEVPTTDGETEDVDTWDDARRLGVTDSEQ